MPKQILTFAVVTIAFAVGDRVGGPIGSILAGVAAFTLALQLGERLEHARGVRGFWLRHRPAFLEFALVVVGILLNTAVRGGVPGFLLGSCSGAWAAAWLNQRWGWAGPALQGALEARSGYLAVLVSAASADGVITPAEADRIAAVGREIFSHLGYGGEADVAGVVAAHAARPAPPDWAASYLIGLAPEAQGTLQFDVLRIIHASGEASPPNRAWLDGCMAAAGLGEWPLLRYFDRERDRAATRLEGDRRAWLAELGLDERADDAAIRAAYRAGARDYHPDRLGGVPAPVRALAEAKMAALNEAYHRLTVAPARGAGLLHFRHVTEARSMRSGGEGEFLCRCWLCGQVSRVPARAEPATCRCGMCHALSGLSFDPTAA